MTRVLPHIPPPDVKPETLPGVLADVARLVGVPAAFRLAAAWGGRRLHLPREPKPSHELCRILGVRQARLLGRHLGGEERHWPSAKTLRHAHDAKWLRRAGWSHKRIAEALGLSQNHVATLTSGVNQDPDVCLVAHEELEDACPTCGRRHRRGGPAHKTNDDRQLSLF
ncbi:MAG: hypothetical protein GC150_17305 [Rhizobiales bacterium]|nr:hypothetical protein [Hyphomicrobiales bacterium]